MTERQQDVTREISRWAIVLGPSLMFSFVLALWLQWLLPQEDDLALGFFVRTPSGLVLAGLWLGVADLDGLKPAGRRALKAATALLVLPWLVLPVVFALISPFLILGVIVFLAFAAATYRGARVLARRIDRRWRAPIAASVFPVVLTFALFGPPMLDSYKWCWPWTSFRREVEVFYAQAWAAGERIKLPSDRALTFEERGRLREETPIDLEFPIPIIGQSLRAHVFDLSRSEYVLVNWSYRTFGAINLRTGWIRSASD